MKKTIFLVLIVATVFCNFIIVNALGITYESTLAEMNSQYVINEEGEFNTYTNSESGNTNLGIYSNINIHNYPSKDLWGKEITYERPGTEFKLDAIISGDDPIIKFIPRDLFRHRGEYFYVGEEYAFIVKTQAFQGVNLAFNMHSTQDINTVNEIDVTIFDINLENDGSNLLKHSVKPLYTFSYMYFSDYFLQNNQTIRLKPDVDFATGPASWWITYFTFSSLTLVDYDFGFVMPYFSIKIETDESGAWVGYSQSFDRAQRNVGKYAIKDVASSIKLKNICQPNEDDMVEYDWEKDEGYRIILSRTEYVGKSISYDRKKVDIRQIIQLATSLGIEKYIGPGWSTAFDIGTVAYDTISSLLSKKEIVEENVFFGDPYTSYRGMTKEEQKSWYETNDFDELYKLWKFDAKVLHTDISLPVIFEPQKVSWENNNARNIYSTDFYYYLTNDGEVQNILIEEIGLQAVIKNNLDYVQFAVGSYAKHSYLGNKKEKILELEKNQDGYVIEGEKDIFSFTSEYSGLYKLECFSNNLMKIEVRNGSKSLGEGITSKEILLEKGQKYDFEVEYCNENNKGRFKVQLSLKKINQLYGIDIDNIMLSKDNEAIVKFVPTESKIYELYFADIRVNQNILEEFILDYNTYANKSATINNFFSLSYDPNQKIISFFNDETYGPKWQWMLDYIIEKAENQSYTRLDLLTTSPNHTYYRLNIHAFLNEAMYSSGTYVSANFRNMSNETFLPRIRVYDKDFNNLERFNFDEISINDYCNNSFEESLVAYFKAGETYYIHIDRNANANYKFLTASLKIGDSRNEIVLNNNHSYESNEILKIEENIRMFKIPVSGLYEINISARDCSSSKIMLIKNTEVLDILTSFKKEVTISKTVFLDEDDLIYIVYINGGNTEGVINISIVENTELVFYIMTDPYWADQSAQIGTEVTVNGKSYYGNTIAIGFTRCAFLSYNYPYESRLDYIWDSTDESVATVTEYGTITALSVGTTTIRVIDKYKMGYLATLDISVYQATFTDEITVQLSTDLNLDPSHNGTEVIYGLGESAGNYIHVGYSRSICIVGPAPSISRQDYIWTIDNPIAFVSIYGMVYAHTPGEATITGVNKYNSSYVGRILIRVLG